MPYGFWWALEWVFGWFFKRELPLLLCHVEIFGMHTWQSEWLTIDRLAVTFNYTHSPSLWKKNHYLTHPCIVSKISTPKTSWCLGLWSTRFPCRMRKPFPMYKVYKIGGYCVTAVEPQEASLWPYWVLFEGKGSTRRPSTQSFCISFATAR